MKALLAVTALLACATLLPVSAADAAKPVAAAESATAMENLDTALAHGLKLLEAKEYKTFIQTFATPDDLKAKGPAVDEIAKNFAGKQSEVLTTIFKGIQGAKPKLSADGNEASFALPKDSVKESIEFTRIGKAWHLKN